MVNDVIAATTADVAAAGVASVEEVRAAGRALGGFSPGLAAQERELKRFMYANLYHHPEQVAAAEAANKVVGDLFAAYAADPRADAAPTGRRVCRTKNARQIAISVIISPA